MTREKVIDILKGIKDGTACLMPNMPEDGEKAIDIAIKAVEQFEPHWIPVTGRLPESAEDDLEYPTVLVCFDNGDVDTACFYESTREWGCGDMYDRICHPIAWMPLPEPYKGGDGMNHDYAHCLDFCDDCPKACFRAQLARDLEGRIDLGGIPLTWMHFKGTEECRKEVME